MNNRSCKLFMLVACICAVSSLNAQTPEPGKQTPVPGKATPQPGKPKEFMYVQRLVPRLYDGKKFTNEDKKALDQHLVRF